MKGCLYFCLPFENLYRILWALALLTLSLDALCGALCRALKESLIDGSSVVNLLEYVSSFRQRLSKACELARTNLTAAQAKMKTSFDRKTQGRNFQPGDALLPIPNQPLQARYSGPFVVEKKISDVNYIIETPGRRKKNQLCHINMLKLYRERNEEIKPLCVATEAITATSATKVDNDVGLNAQNNGGIHDLSTDGCLRLQNSDVLANLDAKFVHLTDDTEKTELKRLVLDYEHLFPMCLDKLMRFFMMWTLMAQRLRSNIHI